MRYKQSIAVDYCGYLKTERMNLKGNLRAKHPLKLKARRINTKPGNKNNKLKFDYK